MVKKVLMLLTVVCILCSFMTGCNQEGSVGENTSEETAESFEPRNIKFTGHSFEHGCFYKDQSADERKYSDALIIKSVDEFNEFKSEYRCQHLDLVAYINSIEDSFFDENALFLHFQSFADCSYQCQIKDLYIEETKLTVTIKIADSTGIADLAILPFACVAEVRKIDIMSVEDIEVIEEYQYWTGYSIPNFDSTKAVDFEFTVFGGTVNNFLETYRSNRASYGVMSVITDQREMKNFLKYYTYGDKGENLNNSADQYNEEFFKNNTIVALPVKTALKDFDYKIPYAKTFTWTDETDVKEGILFGFYICFGEEKVPEEGDSIIFIRFDKSQVPENPVAFAIFSERG